MTKKQSKKPAPRRRRADSEPRLTQGERLIRLEEGVRAIEMSQKMEIQQLVRTVESLRVDVHSLSEKIEEQQHGRDGKPGTLIKLDRLEQSMAQARTVVRLMGGAVVTLVVGAVWAVLTGGSL